MGLNKTRRFVAESLSFTHRYVPVGLLERLPTNMNERAFPYKGRDELEVRPPPSLSVRHRAGLTTCTTCRRFSPRTRPRTGSRFARCSSARRPTSGTLCPRCALPSLCLSLALYVGTDSCLSSSCSTRRRQPRPRRRAER